MSNAAIALIGVVAGALVTGAVQSLAAYIERERGARVAARLLYLALSEADASMQAAKQLQEWNPPTDDWSVFTREWETHRLALARVVNTRDFLAVAAAFSGIGVVARLRTAHLSDTPPNGGTWSFQTADSLLDIYFPVLARAEAITWNGSLTLREHSQRRAVPPAAAPANSS